MNQLFKKVKYQRSHYPHFHIHHNATVIIDYDRWGYLFRQFNDIIIDTITVNNIIFVAIDIVILSNYCYFYLDRCSCCSVSI